MNSAVMWAEKSIQLHIPSVDQLSQATACHQVNAHPARNVTITLTSSVMSVTLHMRQYCSKLNSQFASSLESPSNLTGLSSFSYAAVLPTIACCGATYAVAVAVAIAVAACTAVKAACHRPHTSATISLTFCGAVYVACVRASYKS